MTSKNTTTAAEFIKKLRTLSTPAELAKIERYFKTGKGEYGEGDRFLGVRMGDVFDLAKKSIDMSPAEIEKLMESDLHEARAGAMSIMDKQARLRSTPEVRRRELYELYLRRIDRINNWDLVDLAAQYVIGGYIYNKPRDILYKFARSKNLWERRTAIVATSFFIRKGDFADTFKIAEILVQDREDLIHKAVGGWVREAGKKDRDSLLSFLDRHAATMPRVMLRYAIEHLDAKLREHYLSRAGS